MPLRHQDRNSRLMISFCEVFHSFINSKQCMNTTTMFLNPYCNVSLVRKLSYKDNIADSNTLEITGEIVIPRYILISVASPCLFLSSECMMPIQNLLGTKL